MATNKQGDQEIPLSTDQTRSENVNTESSPQIEEVDVALAGESDRFVLKFNHLCILNNFPLAGKQMTKEISILNKSMLVYPMKMMKIFLI